MARRSKRTQRSRRSGGGTLLGILIGLVVGLAVAVAAALYMTKASVPFVDKGRRPPAGTGDAAKGELPDPNRPLQKGRPASPDAVPGASSAEAPPAPGTTVPPAIPAPPTAVPGAPPVTPPTAPPAAGVPPATPAAPAETAPERASYLLQAGAFKGQEDAEAMKAKLALIGFEATVVTAEVNGVTFYRVRVGPYRQIDDMNRARSRLAENGIEASVVRQR